MLTYFNSQEIVDEIEYVDVGNQAFRPFFSFSLTNLGLSYSDDFEGYYKIAGFTVFHSLNKTYLTRTTYDFLNFLGDVGGLEGILLIIGGIIMPYISSFVSMGFFMSNTFYTKAPQTNQKPS